MLHEGSNAAIAVFALFVAVVLGLSFYLGRKAKSAQGYFAAHGQVPWFINGIAFAGDYLSAASFLGICGMISTFGYDGFLYSIGFLAGWVVALFVIAEPLKRLGRFTFADALDNKFNSRSIKLAAAISTLVVSIFYLIPQMVGAGTLIKPLLGLPHAYGVLIVGLVVLTIVVTAGMVSTTYVQFIKGSLLVIFCTILVAMILNRGLTTEPTYSGGEFHQFRILPADNVLGLSNQTVLPAEGAWKDKLYYRIRDNTTGRVTTWRKGPKDWMGEVLLECQTLEIKGGKKLVNGLEQGRGNGQTDFYPVGHIRKLPGGVAETGPLNPISYFSTIRESEIVLWGKEDIKDSESITTVYYQKPTPGAAVLLPGLNYKLGTGYEKLNFISLMLALFCGTASLPHILIRYYTVKDQASARKSTVVGIASIGFFYILTLYLGLGAMTSGTLDLTDSNMAAPLLSKSFGELPFAVISAIAFTTVLGTVSGLILAASGAVAHDLMTNFLKMEMNDHEKVRAGKIVAVVVGAIAMVLGILFEKMNVGFLVGWAFNIAASANLPSLIMLLFWKRTTKQGIASAVVVGMLSSLIWILLSAQAFKDVYGIDPTKAPVPFSQPAIVTIPLGFVVLVVVSMMTQKRNAEVIGVAN